MAIIKKAVLLSLVSVCICAENFIVQKAKQQTTDGLHEVIGQLIGDSMELRSRNLQSAGSIQQKEIELTKAILEDDTDHAFMHADKRALRRFKLKQQQFVEAQRHWQKIQQEHAAFLEQFEKELLVKKDKKQRNFDKNVNNY